MATGVDAKLLKSTKFPPEFSQKVDMTKVNLQVMKKWIAGKISEILGSEDDVVIELCFNLIEGSRYPDIKSLQIQLTGFLDKDTAPFCKELWNLCLSAQTSPQGVPKELLEAKKLELIQEKASTSKSRPTKLPKKLANGGKRPNLAVDGVVVVVAAPIATVVGEVIETHTVVEGVALAAAGALPAPHHPRGAVAVTTTVDQLEVGIHTYPAIDGLRDAGRPRWIPFLVDLARDPPVQEAVDDQGDVTHHLHTCARDPAHQFLGKTTIDLADARPPPAGIHLRQSDDVIPHLGAAHLLDGDTPGRARLPALTDDHYPDRGAPHDGDVIGTAGVEVLRPVVLVGATVEEDAN
ncbi:hypothetical protein VMCG_01139 [Cytospora schulzeri]|uniref:PWI domain-containing protein n=1 Tax=Cytospora schulzeri TaxID=448051 RepID=A0A423X690_9PEZI|nr:hypothetical protein VMCG_01139 [Valsa malicola]